MLSTDRTVLIAMAADEAGLGHERLPREPAVFRARLFNGTQVAWFRWTPKATGIVAGSTVLPIGLAAQGVNRLAHRLRVCDRAPCPGQHQPGRRGRLRALSTPWLLITEWVSIAEHLEVLDRRKRRA